MEIIRGLENIAVNENTVVTIGTFDGLHLGHRKILDQVLEIAESKKLKSTLVTFEPHPRVVLHKASVKQAQLLSTIDEKFGILESSGLDKVIVIEFNQEFAGNSYTEFVENILIKKLKMKYLVVGYDHAFGKDREGTFEKLSVLSQKDNFAVSRVEPLYVDDTAVSSSLIRNLLFSGEMNAASHFLGRLYQVSGKVVPGDGRGKKLSFPTANIEPENAHKIIPKNGVYAVDVLVQGQKRKAMMNIGIRPTFHKSGYAMEVNIFDWNKDIYGERITVYFKKRLRDEKKFNSVEELITQLKSDREQSLQI